jgi:hypothetical protein
MFSISEEEGGPNKKKRLSRARGEGRREEFYRA